MKSKLVPSLALLVLPASVVTSMASDPPEPKQLLMTQATAGWQAIQAYCTHGEFTCNQKRTISARAGSTRTASITQREMHVLVKDDQFQFIQEVEGPYGRSTRESKKSPKVPLDITKKCVSLNLRNVFALTYRSQAAKWVIEHLNDPTDARIREIRRIQSADWLEFLKAPWSTGNVAFADLVRKPGFQLLNLSSLETPLVKVEFKYTPSADEIRERSVFQPIWALRGGVLKFDQFRHWCLIESDVNVEPERGAIATEHTKIEYDAKDSQALCPNRVLRTLQHPKYSLEWAFHVHKFQHRIVDDREMSLAAFGLPELGPREFQRLSGQRIPKSRRRCPGRT